MHMDEWINNMHQFTNLSQKEFNFHIDIFFLHKIDYYQLKECHLKGTIIGHIPNETVKVCKNKAEKVLHRFLKRCSKKWLTRPDMALIKAAEIPSATKDKKGLRRCDRTAQKNCCAAWHCCAEVTGRPKKNSARPDTAARLKKTTAWPDTAAEKLCGQTCAGRPRPVQPVLNTGSTGFGQDGPG